MTLGGAATRDLEVDLINEDTGVVVATSSSGDITVGNDPNELVQFTTAEPQASYCLRVSLKTPKRYAAIV